MSAICRLCNQEIKEKDLAVHIRSVILEKSKSPYSRGHLQFNLVDIRRAKYNEIVHEKCFEKIAPLDQLEESTISEVV